MALPLPIVYPKLVQQKMIGVPGYLKSLNQAVDIGNAPTVGAVTATVLTASTPSAIVDGTVVTGVTATVQVVLTFVDSQTTHALMPSQAANYYAQPENIMAIAKNHADGFRYAALAALLVQYYAATPGKSEKLEYSGMNFTTNGSDAQNYVALNHLNVLVAYLFSNFQDSVPDDFAIIMYSDAFARFITLRSHNTASPVYDSQKLIWRYMGIPVFVTGYATNFGAASRPAAYITHRDAACCLFGEPKLLGGGPMYHNDGMVKWTTIIPYATNVINTVGLAELMNKTS